MTDQTENATGWRPSPGDEISGKVAELGRGWSDYQGDYYPIVTIQKEDGEQVRIHCFHAVLRNRLVDIQPSIGDRLTIKFLGKHQSKDGRREVSIYQVDAPDRKQDAPSFWQGVGSTHPARNAGPSNPSPDVPLPADEEIPF